MPASVSCGSNPPMEILRSQWSPVAGRPRRRSSKPRRAALSMRCAVQWSVSSSRSPTASGAATTDSVPSRSSSSPDWMSAQLLLLLLPAGVSSGAVAEFCDCTELVRTSASSGSRPVAARALPDLAGSLAPASPSLSEVSKASPSSSARRARLVDRPSAPPVPAAAPPPAEPAPCCPVFEGSSSILVFPTRFSIFLQTDCRIEDRLRQCPPCAETSSSTFCRASLASFGSSACSARMARPSICPPVDLSSFRRCCSTLATSSSWVAAEAASCCGCSCCCSCCGCCSCCCGCCSCCC
mmetsp:Transcript_36286/g.102210  ORF Transcript_36286/g.102210 Transcript_36286/m.102210 type:complete len:296 (-) Transcript_36286:306-1193(-)